MTSVDPDLAAKWRQLVSTRSVGLTLASPDHPIDPFYGCDETGRARLAFISEIKPPLPDVSGALRVTRAQRRDGRWVLSFTLEDARISDVFVRFGTDLIYRSADAPQVEAAFDRLTGAVEEWQRLLRSRSPRTLSLEALRGLIGELWMLVHHFGSQMSATDALAGWLGPLGQPQDFYFPETGLLEAKAVGPTATTVRISSAEQLDPLGETLTLAVLETPEVPAATPGAVNLPTIAGQFRRAVIASGGDPAELQSRLSRLGVDVGDPQYEDRWFAVTSVSFFTVDQHFPAIRSSSLPGGVSRVTYQVDRNSLAPFLTTTRQIDGTKEPSR